MAEIKTQKKKPAWPWIVLGIILLAIVMYLLMLNTKDEENEISILYKSSEMMYIKQEINTLESHKIFLV